MKSVNYLKKYSLYTFLLAGILFTGCGDDDAPEPENELEVITDIKLIFTNDADATDVVEASAKDPDGIGVQELQILGALNLGVDKTYTLTFEIFNNLESPGEDIGAEIEEEDDEHQLFFSFPDDAFANPTGSGNIDAAGSINYNDADGNGNALGLSTSWTTSSTALSAGTFTVRLQHQPDVKTTTSGANDGDTDFDLPFVLNIQ
jgi:hypothetical protein